MTSTGRVFSYPYYLQLQGNKFALSFITFAKVHAKLTAAEITRTESILQGVFSTMPQGTLLSSKVSPERLQKLTIMTYVAYRFFGRYFSCIFA